MTKRLSVHARRFEQNAKDVVARFLMRELIVPNIYFDAPWQGELADGTVDVLAVDRAGSGDVHIVAIHALASKAMDSIPSLMQVPAHFRWLAFDSARVSDSAEVIGLTRDERLYPTPEMGRIGLIEVFPMRGGVELGARILVRANRFRDQLKARVAEFAGSHQADIQYE